MRHKDYWIKSAPTTRGRRGIGTTMHGNRMRSISSSIVYHHASSSPTCIVHSGRTCAWPSWPHGRRWRPLVTTMHISLPRSISETQLSCGCFCLPLSLRPAVAAACAKVVQSPKSWTSKGREGIAQPAAASYYWSICPSLHHPNNEATFTVRACVSVLSLSSTVKFSLSIRCTNCFSVN